MSLTVDVNKIE